MERYSSTQIIKLLKDSGISYFTLTDFSRIFNISNQNTVYKKIQRLEKNSIVKKLINGKYLFVFNKSDDFTTANFLYQPSYISLESALSFYGIITGFNYKISSITIKKTKIFTINQQEFAYYHLQPTLFWGYEKREDFLIADKEKALLDYLYFYTKGLRFFAIEDFDLSGLNKNQLNSYQKKFKNRQLSILVKKLI